MNKPNNRRDRKKPTKDRNKKAQETSDNKNH